MSEWQFTTIEDSRLAQSLKKSRLIAKAYYCLYAINLSNERSQVKKPICLTTIIKESGESKPNVQFAFDELKRYKMLINPRRRGNFILYTVDTRFLRPSWASIAEKTIRAKEGTTDAKPDGMASE